LITPVGVYIAVIAAMAVSAIAGGNAWGIAGALLFLVSDSLIAENRFVAPRS
jgi:alkenylglycerophosphocholine hydrolase